MSLQIPKKKPELKIVFDTNVIFNGSSSELLKEEVELIIKENSEHNDLDIHWYLPQVVIFERQYQMIRKGVELLLSIEKLERLLGHKLAIGEDIIETRVKETINSQISKLSLKTIVLDASNVDWQKLILNSASRKPPFAPGEKEKGFRDSIVLETFLQLVNSSPTTPRICRVVLVSNDKLLSNATKERTMDRTNVRILSTLEDLKSLINTLVAEIDEEFVKKIQEVAISFFFEKDNKESLYFNQNVSNIINEQYSAELNKLPAEADGRQNSPWYISNPCFVKKVRQRVTWTSRISVETSATKKESAQSSANLFDYFLAQQTSTPKTIPQMLLGSSEKNPVHDKIIARGKTIFDVVWSVSVSIAQKFSKPKIDSIKFVETVWE